MTSRVTVVKAHKRPREPEASTPYASQEHALGRLPLPRPFAYIKETATRRNKVVPVKKGDDANSRAPVPAMATGILHGAGGASASGARTAVTPTAHSKRQRGGVAKEKKAGGYYAVLLGPAAGVYASYEEAQDAAYGEGMPAPQMYDTRAGIVNSFDTTEWHVFPGSELPIVRGGYESVEAASSAVSMFASATAVVYTDGSCTGNGTTSSLGGVGVFWGQRGHPYQVSRKASITPATNNTAEFEALEDALAGVEMDQARYTKAAAAASKRGDCTHPPPYSAIIVMDAEYPYNALTQWYDGWKRKGWRTASGTPVANMEILQRVHAQLQRLPVKLYHVIAHGSTAGNQEADALADVYTTHAL